MDGVLCDFEGHFLDLYKKKFPEAQYIPLKERKTFYLDDQYQSLDPSSTVSLHENMTVDSL